MMKCANSRDSILLRKLEHEVRQTLHQFMGLLDLVVETPLSPAQAEYISQCRRGARHLLQIANDSGELASPDPVHSPSSTFCLASMVEEVAGIMRVLAGRK